MIGIGQLVFQRTFRSMALKITLVFIALHYLVLSAAVSFQPTVNDSNVLSQRHTHLLSRRQLALDEKLRDLAMEYMPKFLLHQAEEQLPSNVTFFSEHLECGTEQYCSLKQGKFSSSLPWLRGQDVRKEFVPIYPLIVPRDSDYNVVEIHYDTFFPFNRGSRVMNAGSHIGDWEKVAIRFDKDKNDGSYKPTFVLLSRHSIRSSSWSGSWERVVNSPGQNKDNGNHIRVSVALGGHGNYLPSQNRSHILRHGSHYSSGSCGSSHIKNWIWDWYPVSDDEAIVWEPYKYPEQRNYISMCSPWSGSGRLVCDLSKHPEKAVFEKFGIRIWGPRGGIVPFGIIFTLDDSPESHIVQLEFYLGAGLECAALGGCDRPEWCLPLPPKFKEKYGEYYSRGLAYGHT